MAWNPFKKKAAAVNINDPAFLELMRSGHAGPVNSDSAMRISAVYSCIKVLSESIASMPCSLHKITDDRSEIQRDSNLHSLVNRAPNDFMTAPEFWSFVVASQALHGEAFALIIWTASNRVAEILPLMPSKVGVRVNGRRIEYDVNFGTKDGKENVQTFGPKNILHFKQMTLDGIRGVSPIAYNSAMLGYARDARAYSNSVFENGAVPRGVLTTDGTLSDEAYENVKSSWQAAHGGVENANRVAILEGGLSFQKILMSPADVELLEQFKYTRSEIAGIFRVPLHMIGDLERSTNNNIEHQGLDFYTNTLLPWTTNIESRLNFQLLSTSTQEFRFDNSKVVRGAFNDRVEAMGKLITLGVLNPNEVRRDFGYNPREGGDEYITQSNNLIFGDDQEESPASGEQPNADEAPNDPSEPEE